MTTPYTNTKEGLYGYIKLIYPHITDNQARLLVSADNYNKPKYLAGTNDTADPNFNLFKRWND